MTREQQSLAFGLAAVALWSTVATAFKLALEHFSPVQLLWVASLISAATFWIAAIATGSTRLMPADRWWAVVLGLINPLAYYVLLFEAYDRLPAQIAQPINYTWAVMMALLAVPLLGQKLSARAWCGIVLAYVGVVILINPFSANVDQLSTVGLALALASTILWAIYWIANTRTRSNPIALMAWSFTAALPPLGALCWWWDGWPALELAALPYALWVGLVEMGITFLLWQQALKRSTQVGRTSQLIFLSPFLSLFLIAAFLGETIAATSVAGLVVIVCGVVLTQARSQLPDAP